MKPYIRFSPLSFILLALSAVMSVAQVATSQDIAQSKAGVVPRVVRYAGTLVNTAQAVPAEGAAAAASTAQVRFALYADEQSSTPLWVETQTVSVGADGKYSVLLGATSREGLAPELFQSGESRWLGVKSGDAAEQRVLLVSVPYAMKAGDAETVGGHKISDFLLTPEAAVRNGAVARPGSSAFVDNGNGGTVNQVPKWTAVATLGNSIITDTGTAVGIGVANPAFTIDIKNTDATAAGSNIFRLQTPSVNGAVMHFLSTSANGHDWAFGSNFINGVGEFGVYDYTANTARLFINATGSVGINTSVPQFTMDVQNNDATGAGANIFRMRTPSVNGAVMHFQSTAANGHDWGFGSNFIVGAGEFGFYDYTAGAARVFITGTGNVGIGTTAPGALLDVGGTIKGTALTITGALASGAQTVTGNVTASGSVTATNFVGSGANLTNLPGGSSNFNTQLNVTQSTANPAATITQNSSGSGLVVSNGIGPNAALVVNSNGSELLSMRQTGSNQDAFAVDINGNITSVQSIQFTPPNDSTTPAVVGQLVILTANVTAANAPTSATHGVIGLVASIDSQNQVHMITLGGGVCVFDNTAVGGDYFVASTTQAGKCHDAGATAPTGVQILGRVINKNGQNQQQVFFVPSPN